MKFIFLPANLRGAEAVEDKKPYDKVREAATSLARALKLLAPEPEPPKKHRGLQLVVLVATAGAVKLILNKSRSKGVIDGDPQGQSDRVPQGAGPQREGAQAGAGAA